MGMSDAEYERVVKELQASKGHQPGADYWLLRAMRAHAQMVLMLVRCRIEDRVRAELQGPFASTLLRAKNIEARLEALAPAQMTEALSDRAWSGKALLIGEHPSDAFDQALAGVAAELSIAEARRA